MPEHFISITEAQSDLLSCAAFIAETIQSRDGHAQAMRAVVPEYLAKGDVDSAAEFANTVTDPFVRDKLLISVAEKCAEIDDEDYGLQLADAIEDPGLQAQAREKIGLQMAAANKPEKAREIADLIDHPDTVLSGIAVNQYARDDEAGASATVREIGYPGNAVHALIEMAAADIEAERFEKSAAVLERAAEKAEDIEHDEEKIRAILDIGIGFIAAKRNDRAIEVLEHARSFADVLDNVRRDNFLAGISVGLLRAGSIEFADRTLDSVSDKTQIATCLLGFSRELWRRGDEDDALEALEESYAILRSQPEKETRDSKAKFALFSAIAAQFAGFQKGERAIGIAQEIADEDELMAALGQIAEILISNDGDEPARHAINSIMDDVHRMFALVRASDAAAEHEDQAKAAELLEEAVVLVDGVPQLASRSSALVEIAKRFFKYGDEERAREVSLENLRTVATIKDPSIQASAVASLAEFYRISNLELTSAEKEIIQGLLRKAAL